MTSDHFFDREALLRVPTHRLAHEQKFLVISECAIDPLGENPCITRWYDDSVRTYLVSDSANIGCNHGCSAKHCLCYATRQRLGHARQDEQVSVLVDRAHLLWLTRTQESDSVSESEWDHPLPQLNHHALDMIHHIQ